MNPINNEKISSDPTSSRKRKVNDNEITQKTDTLKSKIGSLNTDPLKEIKSPTMLSDQMRKMSGELLRQQKENVQIALEEGRAGEVLQAIKEGDLGKVRGLLAGKESISKKILDDVLLFAVDDNKLGCVSALLKSGYISKEGREEALIHAASENHPGCVWLLAQPGSNISRKVLEEAISCAAGNNSAMMTIEFLEEHLQKNYPTSVDGVAKKEGSISLQGLRRALLIAAQKGCFMNACHFLKKGYIEPEVLDKALVLAAENDQLAPFIDDLLKKGKHSISKEAALKVATEKRQFLNVYSLLQGNPISQEGREAALLAVAEDSRYIWVAAEILDKGPISLEVLKAADAIATKNGSKVSLFKHAIEMLG